MFFFAKKGLHYSDVLKVPPPGDRGRFSWNLTFLNIREFYIFFSMSYTLGQGFFLKDHFFCILQRYSSKKGWKKSCSIVRLNWLKQFTLVGATFAFKQIWRAKWKWCFSHKWRVAPWNSRRDFHWFTFAHNCDSFLFISFHSRLHTFFVSSKFSC